MVLVEGQPRGRLETRCVVDHLVRSGASGACDERTPKFSERTIDRDRQPDGPRAAVREEAASRTNRALERRSCIAHQTRETGLTKGRLAESGFYLEKWPSVRVCANVYREVIMEVRRTTFLYDITVHGCAYHSSFLTWIKVVFRDGRRLAHLLGRVIRLLRHGARRAGERAPCLGIIPRQLRTPRPADGRLR